MEIGPDSYMIALSERIDELLVVVFDHEQMHIDDDDAVAILSSRGSLGRLRLEARDLGLKTRFGVFGTEEEVYGFLAAYLLDQGACDNCIDDAVARLRKSVEDTRRLRVAQYN